MNPWIEALRLIVPGVLAAVAGVITNVWSFRRGRRRAREDRVLEGLRSAYNAASEAYQCFTELRVGFADYPDDLKRRFADAELLLLKQLPYIPDIATTAYNEFRDAMTDAFAHVDEMDIEDDKDPWKKSVVTAYHKLMQIVRTSHEKL